VGLIVLPDLNLVHVYHPLLTLKEWGSGCPQVTYDEQDVGQLNLSGWVLSPGTLGAFPM